MKVFMPYLTWNTVFDNTRVTAELGRMPVPFSQYSFPLLNSVANITSSSPTSLWPENTRVGGSAA